MRIKFFAYFFTVYKEAILNLTKNLSKLDFPKIVVPPYLIVILLELLCVCNEILLKLVTPSGGLSPYFEKPSVHKKLYILIHLKILFFSLHLNIVSNITLIRLWSCIPN